MALYEDSVVLKDSVYKSVIYQKCMKNHSSAKLPNQYKSSTVDSVRALKIVTSPSSVVSEKFRCQNGVLLIRLSFKKGKK